MPESPEFYKKLTAQLENATDRKSIDMLLDFWNSCANGATDYDARLWGFNPHTWMVKERAEMENMVFDKSRVRS